MKPFLFSLFFCLLVAHAQAITIPQIQGATDISPLVGRAVEIEAVVSADFPGLNGFALQDPLGDGDAATSDGVFVYRSMVQTPVRAGQRVRVRGTVEEFHGQTQIGAVSAIQFVDEAGVPTPTILRFPLPVAGRERFEGMLVSIDEPLTVSSHFDLKRFGSLLLSSGGRLMVSTNQLGSKDDAPARSLVLDDGSSQRNPSPTPYLNAQRTRRTGSRVRGLVGVLTFSHNNWTLHPTRAPTFEDNPRPLSPPDVGGDLKVAAANVLNYFTTFKSADPRARGAVDESAFARQSAKIVAGLRGLDADVVGLMEIETNGTQAINDLVRKLNAAYGRREYAAVGVPLAGSGPDEIKVAMIYKPARLELVGASISATDAIFDRFPLAQTFRDKRSKGVFSVVVNHFKSKGSAPKTGDVDRGEGAWNIKRTTQAQALLGFVDELKKRSGDADVLVIGDLNAYAEETPIRVLRAAKLRHLNLRLSPAERYSFAFGGRFGSLDHALATPELDAQVTGFGEWHINADEPQFLSYEAIQDFEPTPFRASDHDPLLIGLKLKSDVKKAATKKPLVKPRAKR